MRLRLSLLSCALLLLSPPALLWTQAPIPFDIQLTLTDPESGQPRYRGIQRVREEKGVVRSHTEYRNLVGKTLQTVDTSFDKATLTPIRYERLDPESGFLERYTLDGNDVTLVRRESHGAKEEKETVDWIAGWISTVGVPSYIRRNWLEIEDGASLAFPLFVPSRKTAYTFVVKRDESTNRSAEGRMVVRMDADAFVVRQFVDTLWFVFETARARELVVFEGRSSIPDGDGNEQRLRIAFDYKSLPEAQASR